MSLTVVSCEHNSTDGVVVLESDDPVGTNAITEVCSMQAKHEAIKAAAAKGLPDPRIGGEARHYPVDRAGEVVTDPSNQRVHRYRSEIPVVKRLV